jgi:hypothetical protein
MKFAKQFIVEPDTKVKLADCDPQQTLGYKNDAKTQARLDKSIRRLDALQYLLFAESKRALLVILQAMDAGGKDGTIRHVMSGVNPQGCKVTSFKEPSAKELAHDFLWRSHLAAPEKGMIGIFNRSHYEDVLVVRVHKLVPKQIWKERYAQINAFEKLLADNNTKILTIQRKTGSCRPPISPRGSIGPNTWRPTKTYFRVALRHMRRGSSFHQIINGFAISLSPRSSSRRLRVWTCSSPGPRSPR